MTEQYESINTLESDREENIKLWRSVEKTPTSQVKPAKIGNLNIKSVKPHYQRMKATEVFGPFGKGWGVTDETFSRHQIGDTHLLSYKAVFFYTIDSKRYEFPINATQKEAYITNGGQGYLKIDESADKKVATDALTKGLSFLGFSADVFHGLYDDAAYIQRLQHEEGVSNEINAKQDDLDYRKWRKQVLSDAMLCETPDALEKFYFESLRKAQEKGDTETINNLNEVKNQRWKQLTEK